MGGEQIKDLSDKIEAKANQMESMKNAISELEAKIKSKELQLIR